MCARRVSHAASGCVSDRGRPRVRRRLVRETRDGVRPDSDRRAPASRASRSRLHDAGFAPRRGHAGGERQDGQSHLDDAVLAEAPDQPRGRSRDGQHDVQLRAGGLGLRQRLRPDRREPRRCRRGRVRLRRVPSASLGLRGAHDRTGTRRDRPRHRVAQRRRDGDRDRRPARAAVGDRCRSPHAAVPDAVHERQGGGAAEPACGDVPDGRAHGHVRARGRQRAHHADPAVQGGRLLRRVGRCGRRRWTLVQNPLSERFDGAGVGRAGAGPVHDSHRQRGQRRADRRRDGPRTSPGRRSRTSGLRRSPARDGGLVGGLLGQRRRVPAQRLRPGRFRRRQLQLLPVSDGRQLSRRLPAALRRPALVHRRRPEPLGVAGPGGRTRARTTGT